VLIRETGYELLDGTLTLAFAHPIKRLAEEAVALMLDATAEDKRKPPATVLLPFDVYSAENL
jgi:hypothetical protein